MKPSAILALSAVLALLIAGDALFAWTAPGSVPPASNVAAPMHTGNASQIKIGGLGVGSLDVAGGAIVRGTDTVGDIDFRVEGRVAAVEYCDSNGQNCRGPLPSCASGQTLVADASGTWVCGAPAATQPTTVWLVNNQHSESQCTSLGGTVLTDTGGNRFCRFVASACPAGWAKYQNWAAYRQTTSTCGSGTCTSPARAWSNTAGAPSQTTSCRGVGGSDGWTPFTCYSAQNEVGCY